MTPLTLEEAKREANRFNRDRWETRTTYYVARFRPGHIAAGQFCIVGQHALHIFINDVQILPLRTPPGKYTRKDVFEGAGQ